MSEETPAYGPPKDTRSLILAAARRLFFEKGYEAATIQDILSTLAIAKGTLYHHFRSKEQILDGLVRQMSETVLNSLDPVLNNPQLSPAQKLEALFRQGATAKLENFDILKATIQVLYSDHNLKLRRRLEEASLDLALPYYRRLLEEGRTRGEFRIDSAEETARLLLQLGVGLNQALAPMFTGQSPFDLPKAVARYNAYEAAINRILGCPDDTIRLGHDAVLTRLAASLNPPKGGSHE